MQSKGIMEQSRKQAMKDVLDRFENHLDDAAPGFRCFYAGDNTERLTFLAHVRHCIGRTATPLALAALDEMVGSAESVMKAFFARHDGLIMYEDTIPTRWARGEFYAAGFHFYPVSKWRLKTAEMQESLCSSGWEKHQ